MELNQVTSDSYITGSETSKLAVKVIQTFLGISGHLFGEVMRSLFALEVEKIPGNNSI